MRKKSWKSMLGASMALLMSVTAVPVTALAEGGEVNVYAYSKVTVTAEASDANSYHGTTGTTGDGGANFAFDGNLNSLWHQNYGSGTGSTGSTAAPSEDNPIWVQGSLGTEKTVAKLTYIGKANGDNRIVNYKIMVADKVNADGTIGTPGDSDWQEVATGNFSNATEDVTFTPTKATHIRLVALSGNNQNSAQIAAREIEVYETTKPVEKTAGETVNYGANAGGQAITWSVLDAKTSQATDKANITADGVLTPNANGLVEVVATAADGKKASKLLSIQMTKSIEVNGTSYKLADGIEIENEKSSNWTITGENQVQITAAHGGLWQTQVPVNVFKIPVEVQENMSASIKLSGIANSSWEDAGLCFYKDGDNFVSIQKKARDAGVTKFGFIRELNQANTESLYDPVDQEDVYFKLEKQGETMTASYSLDNLSWTALGNDTYSGFSNGSTIYVAFFASDNALAESANGPSFEFSELVVNGIEVPLTSEFAYPSLESATLTMESDTLTVVPTGLKEGEEAVTRWAVSDTQDGEYMFVNAPASNTFSDETMLGKYVKAAVAPVNAAGVAGNIVWTDPVEYTVSEVQEPNATLVGNTLSLDGNIGVNYYVELGEDVTGNAGAYMHFVTDKIDQKVLVSEAGAPVEKADSTGAIHSCYKFTCEVPAKEMCDAIQASIVVPSAEGGEDIKVFDSYSVKKYADDLITLGTAEGAEKQYSDAVSLIKSMLNYGGYAQTYFNYTANGVANENLTVDDSIDPSVVTADTLQNYNKPVSNKTTNVTFAGSNLSLLSQTTLRLYFTIVDEQEENVAFSYNGQALDKVKSGNYYYVEITNIAADKLHQNVTVAVTDGSENVDITYNVMTYCYNVLNRNRAVELQNVVKALQIYNTQAYKYIQSMQ